MAFYDRIAKRWHAVTGPRGGALKEHILNGLVLGKIPDVAGLSILELGAGNGYFMPLVLRHFSGRVPARVVITDQSQRLLRLARQAFKVADADYLPLDVSRPFPFDAGEFDVIVANMVLNEVATSGLRRALRECHRVLAEGGRLVATVLHPAFVDSLGSRKLLKRSPDGVLTMPGAGGLRLPVVRRTLKGDRSAFEEAGFGYAAEDVHATLVVLRAKPGLREAGAAPLALLIEGQKLTT